MRVREVPFWSGFSVRVFCAFLLLLLLGMVVASVGCSGGGTSASGPPPPPPTQAVTVSVSPSSSDVLLGNTQQFTATVTGSANTAVTWSVNGTVGGNSSVGTISTAGLYIAPADLPSPAIVTVAATSQADTSKTANAQLTVISDITVTVQSSSGATSILVNGGLELTATVTSAGNPDKTVQWSVDGVQNGDATVGAIASTGPNTATYTAPATVPTPSNITIQATSVADGGKSATLPLTIVAGLAITSLSSVSPMPLAVLQIGTVGINPSAPAIVQFSSSVGFSAIEQSVRIQSDGTIIAGVPLYVDPSSGQIAQGTVSVVVTQGTDSTAPATLIIQNLPPLSTYGVPLGQISHAFLVYEALSHARRLNELQAAQALVGGAVDTSGPQSTVKSLLDGAILARADIDNVMLNGAVVSWGTLPDGTALQFDSNQLDVMDRVIAVYLTQQFGSLSSLPPQVVRGMGLVAGPQSGSPSNVLDCLVFESCAEKLQEEAETSANPTDTGVSFWTGLFSVLSEPVAEKFAAGVGMVSGLLHVQEAVDSELQGIGLAADCNASTNCTSAQAQAIDNTVTSSAVSAAVGVFATAGHIPILADLVQEGTLGPLPSQSAEAAALFTSLGNLGQLQNARNTTETIASQPTFSEVSGHLGIMTGTAQITNSLGTAAAQSGLDLCCFGTSSLGIIGLADPGGNYDLFVPLGVSNTSYSSMSGSIFDPLSGTTLASTTVNLTSLSPTNPVTAPTITGSCNDTDASSPDADDPDCD